MWTVAGYGAGGLRLDHGGGAPIDTGALDGHGRWRRPAARSSPTTRASNSPSRPTRCASARRPGRAPGPAATLVATLAAVSRMRTAIEGSQNLTFAGRVAFTPSVELGIRQDGGDAEVGRGLDVGLGLVFADAVTGLAVDVRVRRLLVHPTAGFAESGMAVSVSYDPTPSTPLGLTARFAPAWGGDAMSGAEALWGRDTMSGMGMAGGGMLPGGGNRLATEVGYGLPVGSRFVWAPRVGRIRLEASGRLSR